MVRIAPQPSSEICDLPNELYEGVRKYVYAYGLRWGSRLPPGLAGNPTRLSLASVGPTAPSTETRRRRVAPFTQKASTDSVPPTFPSYSTTHSAQSGCIASGQVGSGVGFNKRSAYTANLSLLCSLSFHVESCACPSLLCLI